MIRLFAFAENGGSSIERSFTPERVARRFGVSRTTVIEWCEAGVIPAVNVASPHARRKRWRVSEKDIEAFEERRANTAVSA